MILFVLRQRFQHVEVGVNIIVSTADQLKIQIPILVPCFFPDGCESETTKDTDGIGCCRIDRFAMLNKIADDHELSILHFRRSQVEVLISQTKLRIVHRETFGDIQSDLKECQRADTLCQLQQELPCRTAFLVTAGQHIQQALQLFRNGHFGHIQCECVIDLYILFRIQNIIDIQIVLIHHVFQLMSPGQQTIGAGGSIEVKVCFILIVQIRRQAGDHCHHLGRSSRHCLAFCLFLRYIGFEILHEHPLKLFQELILEFLDLVYQHCANGNIAQLAFSIGRVLKSGQSATLGPFLQIKDHLRYSHGNIAALQAADGLQRDFHEHEHDVIFVDLYRVSVIGSLHRQCRCLAIDGIDTVFCKFQVRGLHHMNGLAAQNGSIFRYQLDLHFAQRSCYKEAVLDIADFFIGYLQLTVFGQCDGTTGSSNANGLDWHLAVHGQIVIIRRDHRMIKHVGRLCSRNDCQRSTDRPLITIGRLVHHFNGILTLSLCSHGRRAAAIQAQGIDTSCFQHDLSDLNGSTTSGERLLATIQYHQYHLAIIGDAHAGTRYPIRIIVIAGINSELSILHQDHRAAHRFLDLILISTVFRLGTNHRCTVLQNSKEVFTADAVIFHALHHQCTGGATGSHVIEVCIHAGNNTVVGNISILVRISMLVFQSLHLLCQPLHTPSSSAVIFIVGNHVHIIASDIRRCQIVDDLLAIGSLCSLDLLRNTGSQLIILGIYHIVVSIVVRILNGHIQIIRKGIATSLAQICIHALRQIGTLQGEDAFVSHINAVH